jgi:hypothetical protein
LVEILHVKCKDWIPCTYTISPYKNKILTIKLCNKKN